MSVLAKRLYASAYHFSLGDIVLDDDPALPTPKGHTPNFRPMSVVAKRLDGLRYYLV